VEPSSTSPVAIGSAPGSSATFTLVRITVGSPALAVAEAALGAAASSSPPPHAPPRSTPPRTSTSALRMTALRGSRDPSLFTGTEHPFLRATSACRSGARYGLDLERTTGFEPATPTLARQHTASCPVPRRPETSVSAAHCGRPGLGKTERDTAEHTRPLHEPLHDGLTEELELPLRADLHEGVHDRGVLGREPETLEEIVQVQPRRRAPTRRGDRPGVHADEGEVLAGEFVPAAVQGAALEVAVVARRRGIGAAGIRGQRLDENRCTGA